MPFDVNEKQIKKPTKLQPLSETVVVDSKIFLLPRVSKNKD